MAHRPDYFDKYKTIALDRSEDGVLTMRLHSDNGPVKYGSLHHSEWIAAFSDIGLDRNNRVIVLTGTGDSFMDSHASWDEPVKTPKDYDLPSWREKIMFRRMFEIEAPMICAINGPATIHAELGLLGDITLASDNAFFADEGHFPVGEVPGDGVHIVWQELLGANRGKYFLLTGQHISAQRGFEIGFINEVLSPQDLMPRALELAGQLATYDDLTLRYTRQCFIDRWKQLFNDKVGVGYGMALEILAHLDRGWQVYDGSHVGNADYEKFRRLHPRNQGD